MSFEQHGAVAVVTIRRPDARNAVDGEVARGIEAAVDRIEADDGIRAAVLAAEGPAFCSGADLALVAAGRSDEFRTERGGFGGLVRRARAKPLIAAVDGPAVAGGCELALACDLIVASTAAWFSIPEVQRGLVAAAGGLFRLPRRVPENVAMEMVLTGEPLSAERACHFGLVSRLVEPGAALSAALALAARIAENAPVAVRESRAVLAASAGAGDEEAWRLTLAARARNDATADKAEGAQAFLEKRPPQWQGR